MSYPVNVSGSVPVSSSRGLLLLRVFFGWAYVGIPHGFCLMFRMIATEFLCFIAFWAILFTGKYPKKMFDFNVGTYRWMNNIMAYMLFLTDTYPPFSGKRLTLPLLQPSYTLRNYPVVFYCFACSSVFSM